MALLKGIKKNNKNFSYKKKITRWKGWGYSHEM